MITSASPVEADEAALLLMVAAQNPAADVCGREAESDPRVYARHGLTAEEIRIVEGETP